MTTVNLVQFDHIVLLPGIMYTVGPGQIDNTYLLAGP